MPNKVIAITGERDGAGKTTLAINIAARLSQMRHQPAVIIDADPLCRNEAALAAVAKPSMSVIQILDQLASKQMSWTMLRGRLSTNAAGVGVIPLAANPKESERLTLDQWNFFLRGLSQLFDVIIDLAPIHPLKNQTLDMADAVGWVFLPHALSVQATLQHAETLAQRTGLKNVLFILNQAGLPETLSEENVARELESLEKGLCVALPFEPEILSLLNHSRPVISDSRRSGFFQKVTTLTDEILKLSKTQGSGLSKSATVPGQNGAASGVMTQDKIVDKILQEKLTRWNQLKQHIHRDLVEELNSRRVDLDTKGDPVRERQLRTNVESTVNSLLGKEKDIELAREEREQLVKELVDEALGLGPLEELLRDPAVTEIMVNRFDQVYIERRGKIFLSDKRFIDNNHIVQVIRRIIAPLGRRIDESTPLVDARLRDGSRVNAVIPPLAVSGPTLTIRRFPEKAFGADDLVRIHSLSKPMVEFLRVCVLAKKNIVISGGTGTGKTTILNMLSSFIPNDERIVTVEDTAELRLQQEHIVRLEARPANIEGHGAVTIRDLVKNCLRMRPDRIVVGECRAGEALDMLQAMNTGHDGSLTTIHANTARDCFTRLETLCLMAGMDLPVWALREQIRAAVHVVVQLARLQDGTRRVVCITEVTGRTEETILTEDLFRFVQDSVDKEGVVQGHFEATGTAPRFLPDLKAKGLALDDDLFRKTT